jgi:hypothetical protein
LTHPKLESAITIIGSASKNVFNGAFHICPIFTKKISCKIFHVFLDTLPMMVIALSNFG